MLIGICIGIGIDSGSGIGIAMRLIGVAVDPPDAKGHEHGVRIRRLTFGLCPLGRIHGRAAMGNGCVCEDGWGR
jgi:hypothetical protein